LTSSFLFESILVTDDSTAGSISLRSSNASNSSSVNTVHREHYRTQRCSSSYTPCHEGPKATLKYKAPCILLSALQSYQLYAPAILSMKKIASTYRIESWEDPICNLGKVVQTEFITLFGSQLWHISHLMG